ncbi:MAG: carbohydrate ABC transporter permease [Saccharofermentanales bacterium]
MPATKTKAMLIRHRIGTLILSLLRFVIIFGLAFIILKPFFYKIMMAFMDPEDLLDSTVRLIPRLGSWYYWKIAFVGLKLSQTAVNTFILSLSVGVIQVISCTMIGYGLARFRFAGSRLAFTLVLLIMLVPFQVISIAQYLGFSFFRIGGMTVNLVDSFAPILILAFTGLGIKEGLYIYLFREFFKSLPKTLEEAAYIDGSGAIRTFYSVMMPNARTLMTTVFLFSFCWQWTDSIYSTLYFYEMPVFANTIAALYIRVGLNADMLGTNIARNAAAMLIMIPLLILFGFCQKTLIKSVAMSGLAN